MLQPRSNLDGSNMRVLVDKFIEQPNALTLDYENDMIYWYDSCRKYIGKSDLKGDGIVRLIDGESIDSIAVYHNLLFWHITKESAVLYTDIGNNVVFIENLKEH